MIISEKLKKYGILSLIAVVAIVLVIVFTSGCNHEWIARCEMRETCINCGEERGDILEHNYNEGKCLRCGRRDPDFLDLNNFGFSYMYGMNTWIEIGSYNMSTGVVKGKSISFNQYEVPAYQFFDNYYKYENQVWYDDLIDGRLISNPTNVVFNRVSNDSIDSERGTWTIFERVIEGDSRLVLKVKANGKERWFVPAELLDLSSSEAIEESSRSHYIKMYFKK